MKEQKDKAFEIFDYGRCYSIAAKNINKWSDTHMNFLIPSTVNAAFALELYFKSLYFLEKGKNFKKDNKYSHDISALYKELNNSTRQNIESVFNELIKKRNMNDIEDLEKLTGMSFPRDLLGNLIFWKDVFVSVRYIYDGSKKEIKAMFFPQIEESVLTVIYLLKPDWKNKTILWKKV